MEDFINRLSSGEPNSADTAGWGAAISDRNDGAEVSDRYKVGGVAGGGNRLGSFLMAPNTAGHVAMPSVMFLPMVAYLFYPA